MESAKLTETGRIIQEKRIALGFTQKSLAQALHITDKAISKWERGICLPDVSLLPKLSLLLDVDVDILVSKSIKQQKWVGLIEIYDTDLSQTVYDKPLVYYLLSHYLLLGITKIHILTDEKNREYLSQKIFETFGFHFDYEIPHGQNMMVLNHPWFLFGSDLTQHFQGAMICERNTKLVPDNQDPVFYFSYGSNEYFENKRKFLRNSSKRTLGRGMICIGADSREKILDIATFVRTYQNYSQMPIGSLEEIAYKRGMITIGQMKEMAQNVSYGDILVKMVN